MRCSMRAPCWSVFVPIFFLSILAPDLKYFSTKSQFKVQEEEMGMLDEARACYNEILDHPPTSELIEAVVGLAHLERRAGNR